MQSNTTTTNPPSPPHTPPYPALVVGHYCHDSIRLASGMQFEALGGSVSYITNVFDALGIRTHIISKVGLDFAYSSQLNHLPRGVCDRDTTRFFADFSVGEERVLKAGSVCEPIFPWDIPVGDRYELGLAVGVAGEILTETLEAMANSVNRLVVDVQALIRTIDPVTGLVGLRRLAETPFYGLLHRISFLKAARNESIYIDVEDVRQRTCLIITEGELGCTVYCKDRKFSVPAFSATQVDPTGAGDSFLAGFSAGLYQGLSTENAALMGNYFGALAVGQIGVPQFTDLQIQNLEKVHDGQVADGISFPNHMDISQKFGRFVIPTVASSSENPEAFPIS